MRRDLATSYADAGISPGGLRSAQFTGPTGAPIRRGNFNKLVGWIDAVKELGVAGLHFHDLQYTGNTLAADSGGEYPEPDGADGHDSMNAAIIYQHASSNADRAIASAVDELLQRERSVGLDGEKPGRVIARAIPGHRDDETSGK